MDMNDKPGGTPKPVRRVRRGSNGENESGMAAYANSCIPGGAAVDFIFKEDFNGDRFKEAFVGYTQYLPFPPESAVIYIYNQQGEFKHLNLIPALDKIEPADPVILDNAFTADTNGDGRSELILSFVSGNGHFAKVLIFHFNGSMPVLAWQNEDILFHGCMDVCDIDKDGTFEIIIENSVFEGSEILALNESCYHVRKSRIYKWDGNTYSEEFAEVRTPYLSYNTAVAFLCCLMQRDYEGAFNITFMPEFLGLDGLDDCSPKAFKKYVLKNIVPELKRNLQKGKLVPGEPNDTYCVFTGHENEFLIELFYDKGNMKVRNVKIVKKV